MEDIKVGYVCVILTEQMNIKTVGDQDRKKETYKIYLVGTVACKSTSDQCIWKYLCSAKLRDEKELRRYLQVNTEA